MTICVFCQQVCDPAPTTRGWAEVGNQQGLHFDCAMKVVLNGNAIVAGETRSNRVDIEKAGFEYVYKNISTHRVNANYSNDDDLRAFVDGFEFAQWCNEVEMTEPEVPLHIKYRMYYNQKQTKQ